MHDELFKKLAIVARYRAGPYVEARERFLRQASAEGYSRSTLERIAWVLLNDGEGGSEPRWKHQLHTAEELARPTYSAGQWTATIAIYGKPDPSFRGGLAAQHRRATA